MAAVPLTAAQLQEQLNTATQAREAAEAREAQARSDQADAERRLQESQTGLLGQIGQLGQAIGGHVGDKVSAAVTGAKIGGGFVYKLSLSSDPKTDRDAKELPNQNDPKVVDDVTPDEFVYHEISNGVGDLPVPEHILLAFISGVWPALSVFDDTVIAHLSALFFTFLPPGATAKDVAKARDKMLPYQTLDRLLPLPRALAAFHKFGEMLKTYNCKTDAARRKLNSDIKFVISDLITRSSEPGKDKVAVAYLNFVVNRIRTGMTAKTPWDKNRPSAFSEATWKAAVQDIGGNAKADFMKIDETDDKALSPFGAAVKLAYSPTAPAQAAAKVAAVVQEQRKLVGAVLNGEQPDIGIPKSLKYDIPSSLLGQRDSEAGKVTTRRGGADTRDEPKPYSKGQGFRCYVCLEPDHDFRSCTKLPNNVRVQGERIYVTSPIDGKTEFCRNKMRDACPKRSADCRNIHVACLRCGKAKHIARECDLNRFQ